jgi:cytochrome oxidase assembly protein ShyY1
VLVPALAALFAVYVLLTLWQMRRAFATTEAGARLREARRLLVLVSAGVPLLAVLILVAL